MKTHKRQIVLSGYFFKTALLLLFFVFAHRAQSQSLWLPDIEGNSVGIELLKPSFDDGGDISFLSSAQILSGKYKVGDNLFLTGELPFSYFNSDFDDSEFAIGNPYLGIQMRKSENPHFLEAGLRVPLASDNKVSALASGIFADWDRAEAFISDYITFSFKYNYLKKNSSNFIMRWRGGPSFWISTDNDEPEILLDYSGQAGYDGADVQVLGGFTGRFVATGDGELGERTVHHFGVSAHYKSDNIHPGILIRLPLDDDFNDVVNYIFGINLLININ